MDPKDTLLVLRQKHALEPPKGHSALYTTHTQVMTQTERKGYLCEF